MEQQEAMMPWIDEPDPPERRRWSPDEAVGGTERPRFHVTDHDVMMLALVVIAMAVVVIAAVLVTR